MIKALRNLQVYDAHAPVSETTCVPSGWVGAHWDLNPRCHFHYEMGGVKPNMKKKIVVKYFFGLPVPFCKAHFVAKEGASGTLAPIL